MKAYLYVFNTLSDWEIGYLTAELNSGRYFKEQGTSIPVISVATSMDPVRTVGGIRILPDCTLSETTFEPDDLIILPGGETWLDGDHSEIMKVVKAQLNKNSLIAAICGATSALQTTGC